MIGNIGIIELARYEAPEIIESKQKDWVLFGDSNSYFTFLIEAYKNSSTNNAIINNVAKLIYGKGITATNASARPNEWANFLSIISSEDLRKVALDYKLTGNFTLQVHYNDKHDAIIKVMHLPVQNCAPQKCDENGLINNIYYCDNWADTRNFEPKKFPAFGTLKEKIEILHVKNYSVGMKYFGYPDYLGGVQYAVLEQEIGDYLINEVQNGFSGTKIINFNGITATPEQKDELEAKVKARLSGSKGQKTILSFNANADEKTEVVDVPLNDAPEHYQYLSNECRDKLLCAHNITSPMLVGISKDTNGFSSTADEIQTASKYFYNSTIRNYQDTIIDALEMILAFNKLPLKLSFKRLDLLYSEDEQQQQQPTTLSAQATELESILNEVDNNQLGAEWVIVDERNVSDNEDELNEILAKAELEIEPKQTFLSKLINLVQSGTANPKMKSAQDKQVGDYKYFKVRYRYNGNKTPDREFCKVMMSKQDRLFRKEDIDNMSLRAVNPGFGEFGANTYDIFRFKGGARCNHKWERVTYMLDLNAIENGYEQIGTRAAEIKGYKVTNPYEVSIYPKNLPLKGFSPRNKNLPKDVK